MLFRGHLHNSMVIILVNTRNLLNLHEEPFNRTLVWLIRKPHWLKHIGIGENRTGFMPISQKPSIWDWNSKISKKILLTATYSMIQGLNRFIPAIV